MAEGEGEMFQENSIETCILSRVKEITSPGWMHETSARTWCTGKTQRDWVEREVGGGIGMGNTCKSMADSCQCMTKTTTIKEKQLKEKNKEVVFFPLYILVSFVKDKVSIGSWIYLWALYSVPLIYISVFVPVPYCRDDCGFVV